MNYETKKCVAHSINPILHNGQKGGEGKMHWGQGKGKERAEKDKKEKDQ